MGFSYEDGNLKGDAEDFRQVASNACERLW